MDMEVPKELGKIGMGLIERFGESFKLVHLVVKFDYQTLNSPFHFFRVRVNGRNALAAVSQGRIEVTHILDEFRKILVQITYSLKILADDLERLGQSIGRRDELIHRAGQGCELFDPLVQDLHRRDDLLVLFPGSIGELLSLVVCRFEASTETLGARSQRGDLSV